MIINIQAPTIEDEIKYASRIAQRLDFYAQKNYKNVLPDDLQRAVSESGQPREVIQSYIQANYCTSLYDAAIQQVKALEIELAQIYDHLLDIDGEVIQPILLLTITFTPFGPGGSYNVQDGKIIIKVKEGKYRGERPLMHVLAHELVHILVDKGLVEAFGLSHSEKEAVIDGICHYLLMDYLQGYTPQQRSDQELLKLLSNTMLPHYPEAIGSFKGKQS